MLLQGGALEEIVKIMECMEDKNQIVIPVFYNMDPIDVRNQIGTYVDAFAQHEQRYHSMDMLQSWRYALRKVANLSGCHYLSNFE